MSLSLSDAIGNLRSELLKAQKAGAKDDLKFEVKEIELELQLVACELVEGEVAAEGEFSVWSVLTTKIGSKVKGSSSDEHTHRVTMKLAVAPNEDGSTRQIKGEGEEPESGSDQES